MRWYHVFTLPQYISRLENKVDLLDKTRVTPTQVNVLEQKLLDQEKELALYKDAIADLQKRFAPLGTKNDIEEKDDESFEIDENYRIPIIEGVNMLLEGQDQSQSIPFHIYSGNDFGITPPTKVYGSRQSKKKVN